MRAFVNTQSKWNCNWFVDTGGFNLSFILPTASWKDEFGIKDRFSNSRVFNFETEVIELGKSDLGESKYFKKAKKSSPKSGSPSFASPAIFMINKYFHIKSSVNQI